MLFEWAIDNISFHNFSLASAIVRLGTAGLIGFLISLLCRLYSQKEKEQQDMLHSLIFLSVIICGAMMAIGNNLASAFGLVGAVSIIRFRTSVKSSRDMSFVFFTIVMGMGCGLGFIWLSLINFILISVIMLIIYYSRYGKNKIQYLTFKLKISFSGDLSQKGEIDKVLHKSCEYYNAVDIKVDSLKVSIIYNVSLMEKDLIVLLISDLKKYEFLEKGKIQFSELQKEK